MDCLPKVFVNKFLEGIKSGELDRFAMTKMTSQQRRDLLSNFVGDQNAKWVNTQFETKLLLKDQQRGILNWVKSVAGLKPEIRRDIFAKVERLQNVLEKADLDVFLEDLVAKRLGITITEEESTQLFKLTDKIKSLKKGTIEYGRAKVDIINFMRENAPKEKFKLLSDPLSVWRALMTGFDLSAIRQGSSQLFTRQFRKAFVNMFKYAKSENYMNELESQIYGHKYADILLKHKKDLGLTILGESFTQREEEFASRFIGKIPLLSASGRAFEGFLNDLRFNRFVDIIAKIEKTGDSITKDKNRLTSLAKVISAATGRGSLGKAEAAGSALSTALFSPRWAISRVQLVTNILTKTGEARTEALKSLGTVAGLTLGMASLAVLMGFDVEDDPRSSDFLKIKAGNTRYDFSGGLAQYIVLLSRIAKGETKSSVTGKITALDGSKFGGRSKWTVLTDFIGNKTSPLVSVVRDILSGQDFEGNPLNKDTTSKEWSRYALSKLEPLIAKDTIEAFKENSQNKTETALLAYLGATFGVSVNTYQWKPSTNEWKDLKRSNPEMYDKRVNLAQNIFKEELSKMMQRPMFINAQDKEEKGKQSKARLIDLVKDMATKRALRQKL